MNVTQLSLRVNEHAKFINRLREQARWRMFQQDVELSGLLLQKARDLMRLAQERSFLPGGTTESHLHKEGHWFQGPQEVVGCRTPPEVSHTSRPGLHSGALDERGAEDGRIVRSDFRRERLRAAAGINVTEWRGVNGRLKILKRSDGRRWMHLDREHGGRGGRKHGEWGC